MGNPEPVRRYTVAEYLSLEEAAEYRSEFFEGEIFAMAGGTANHDRIASDADRLIGNAILERGCETFTSNMKVRIQDTSAYYYPDLSVVCGKSLFEDEKQSILTNPVLIIEVLSESTADFDRGKKFSRYRQISTLQEYVLISHTEPMIDVYFKTDQGFWRYDAYEGLDANLELRSLNIQLKLADIYCRVEFAEQA